MGRGGSDCEIAFLPITTSAQGTFALAPFLQPRIFVLLFLLEDYPSCHRTRLGVLVDANPTQKGGGVELGTSLL